MAEARSSGWAWRMAARSAPARNPRRSSRHGHPCTKRALGPRPSPLRLTPPSLAAGPRQPAPLPPSRLATPLSPGSEHPTTGRRRWPASADEAWQLPRREGRRAPGLSAVLPASSPAAGCKLAGLCRDKMLSEKESQIRLPDPERKEDRKGELTLSRVANLHQLLHQSLLLDR